ncbi:uncharacterized protein N7496_008242 [Penicillium cataractarum]|uniref:Reverse transcriptase Ty1/copia-type domain-containing protein n=1 Tax=Penicillium cataractarum TaxID=2100454 RepID=A0A9W9RY10_9EURO|nr:uncharacterized protein N7496_008242 [Penicillium cataractarum]KAJ5368482.1 hypothetical protein N7496_008242 [Penicillium cataractarum]
MFNHASQRKEAAEVSKRLNEAWELRLMGEAQWFLGIRILRDRQIGAIWLCQDAYLSVITHKYHLTGERRLEAPPVNIANLKPFDGMATNEHRLEYSSKVGSAQYATTITRPDVTKVIAFMYQTRDRAICFRRSTSDLPSVQFCSDASFGDNHDRKSSGGYLCKVFGGPVDWKAAKQKTVTTSTTEAELLAISEAGKSMRMWERIFQRVIFNPGHPVSIQCDNKQTITLLTKEAPHLRTKLRHIDIYQHWLRQEVQAGRIPVDWVPTAKMDVDGLTKLLPRQKHARFVRQLGMEDIRYLLERLN